MIVVNVITCTNAHHFATTTMVSGYSFTKSLSYNTICITDFHVFHLVLTWFVLQPFISLRKQAIMN